MFKDPLAQKHTISASFIASFFLLSTETFSANISLSYKTCSWAEKKDLNIFFKGNEWNFSPVIFFWCLNPFPRFQKTIFFSQQKTVIYFSVCFPILIWTNFYSIKDTHLGRPPFLQFSERTRFIHFCETMICHWQFRLSLRLLPLVVRMMKSSAQWAMAPPATCCWSD